MSDDNGTIEWDSDWSDVQLFANPGGKEVVVLSKAERDAAIARVARLEAAINDVRPRLASIPDDYGVLAVVLETLRAALEAQP